MGLLDKLKFWKREEPGFDLGRYPGLEAAPPGTQATGFVPPLLGGEPHIDELGPAPLPPEAHGAEIPSQQPWPARPAAPMLAPQAVVPVAPAALMPDFSRDMQVVQAKLDTLKALLDSVIGKLERIERSQQPREEEPVSLGVRRWR